MSADPIDIRDWSRSLPMALMRAREAAMRTFRPMLARHDLTEQQWRVLRVLADANRGLDVSEIASRTFLLGPSLSRILANLEKRAVVTRSSVDHDGRRARISLTDDGRDLVRAVAPRTAASYAAIEEQFGAERLEQLLDLLDDLAAIDSDTRASSTTGIDSATDPGEHAS